MFFRPLFVEWQNGQFFAHGASVGIMAALSQELSSFQRIPLDTVINHIS